MFKNYLKTALRVLFKNKLYTIINIVGLGVAIGCSIVAYLNYQFSQNFDSYHVNKDRIYRLNSYKIINNQRENWAVTPMPMAPALKENIAGVDEFSRIARGSGIFRYGEKVFNENFHYVDKDFYDMFTFPVKYGSKKTLYSNDGIVLIADVAEKYFGDINPVGKQITIRTNGKKFEFVVSGVVENPPLNSSLYIRILFPMGRYKDLTGIDPADWKNWAGSAFIMLKENSPVSRIEQQLQSYKEITNQSNKSWRAAGFYLDPLPLISFHYQELRANILKPNLHPAAIMVPSIVAALVLLLACFNFLNTSIAFSGKRLNEIAVRKVLGVKKLQLLLQFIGESFILSFIALLIGIMFAEVFVPAYASLWPQLHFPTNFLADRDIILFLVGLLFFITITSGAYPAIYISSYKPVSIFRNKQKLKGANPLIRILLVFQFTLSMITIISGVVFSQNADFVRNYDMGFEVNKIIAVPVQNENDFKLYKSKIENNPQISEISATRFIVGFGYNVTEALLNGTRTQLNYLVIGENYLQTMRLKVIKGRGFNKNMDTDYDASIMVNESFVKKYNWNSIEGKTIKFNNDGVEKEYKVIGIVKDFNTNGVWHRIEPLVLRFSRTTDSKNMVIRFSGNDTKGVYEYLAREWKKLFPDEPFDAFYQSDMLNDAIFVSNSISTVMYYVALLALIISAMGLFALISLSISKRTKEIGIRKVLGATVTGISRLITKEYIILFILSSGIAIFSGYYLSKMFISSIFVYYVKFGVLPFLVAIMIVFFIVAFTIGYQIYKAATSNPVEALRYE